MFHRDGRWKEFGIGDVDGGTVFPFWLFCIIWAAVSYLVTHLMIGNKVTPMNAVAATAPLAPLAPLRNTFMESGPEEPPMKSGYYRLNTAGSKKGVPRYVYVGPDEPEDA